MGELIPMKEAMVRAGVSHNTFRKLIKRHNITLYTNPKDTRQKLIDTDELDAALTPKPITNDTAEEELR